METMFERYGGFSQVSRIVSSFYDRVLDSPIMGPYFKNVDMKRQIDHQTKFISFLMGGPASYSDEHIHSIHQRLNVTPEAMDEMVELMVETLEDFDVEESDIEEIQHALLSRTKLIISDQNQQHG